MIAAMPQDAFQALVNEALARMPALDGDVPEHVFGIPLRRVNSMLHRWMAGLEWADENDPRDVALVADSFMLGMALGHTAARMSA